MSTTEPIATGIMAAEILESSSAGFAAAANAVLQSSRPDGQERNSTAWQQHFQQRVLELAAALRVGEPGLFASRIAWLRRASAARNNDDSEIRQALKSLRAALQSEMPDFIAASVNEVVELALAESEKPLTAEDQVLDPATPEGKLGLDYIAACLDAATGNPVDLIMAAIDDGMKPETVYCQVLLKVQKEVGQLWHVGDFSVSEERLVSETTRRVMSLIATRFKPDATNGRTVLCASVAGNAHDIGLRTVSDLFSLAGWRTLFLGANVPSAEIAGAASEYAVDLVVLTATLTPQLNALTNAIKAIKQEAPGTPVLVGGIAFDDSEEIWRRVGADGFARQVDQAVQIGTELTKTTVDGR